VALDAPLTLEEMVPLLIIAGDDRQRSALCAQQKEGRDEEKSEHRNGLPFEGLRNQYKAEGGWLVVKPPRGSL
jgi:hypothetical protein